MFCFKKKIKQSLRDQVIDRKENTEADKRHDFMKLAIERKLKNAVDRIAQTGENKEKTDYGKIYTPKDTHSEFRKKLIIL